MGVESPQRSAVSVGGRGLGTDSLTPSVRLSRRRGGTPNLKKTNYQADSLLPLVVTI